MTTPRTTAAWSAATAGSRPNWRQAALAMHALAAELEAELAARLAQARAAGAKGGSAGKGTAAARERCKKAAESRWSKKRAAQAVGIQQ